MNISKLFNWISITKDNGIDDEPYELVERFKKWKIHQTYDEYNMEDVKCNGCGSYEFNVGVGSYFTAIRCSKCGWEECIHDG